MSKSLKNFVTIDVGNPIFPSRVLASSRALTGNTSTVHTASAEARLLDTALEREGRFFRITDGRRG